MSLAPLPGSPAGQVVPPTKSGRLIGYNLRETTGTAAAVVRVYSGVSVGGNLLATIGLAAGASQDISYNRDTAAGFVNGLYVQTVSGATPEGNLRYQVNSGGQGG